MSHHILDKYPLIQKALREQADLFSFLGNNGTPNEINKIQDRAFELIEAYIDRPKAEKEALMVNTVFSLSPPYIMDNIDRLDQDYSPEVKFFAEEMVNTPPHSAVLPTNLSQTTLAVATCMLEDLETRISTDKLPMPPAQMLRTMQESALEEATIFDNCESPRLLAAYRAKRQDVAQALKQKITPGIGPVKKHPKNNGSFDL